jgi:small subunit ribosomal protein S19e
MASVKFAQPGKLIAKAGEELKKVAEIKPTEWAKFVKSGPHRSRPPQQPDFWYTRSASILRRIYLDGPIGVARLRSYFGGRKKVGYSPAKFRRAAGNEIRKILQQLEKAGYVEKGAKGGRKVTAKGRKFLDNVAKGVNNDRAS